MKECGACCSDFASKLSGLNSMGCGQVLVLLFVGSCVGISYQVRILSRSGRKEKNL